MIVRELITKLGFKTDESGLKKGQQAANGFKSSMLKLGAVVAGGAVVFYSLNKLIGSTTAAWERQEEAIANVGATLQSTGGIAGRTLEQITAQASELQKKTFFGDETILQAVSAQLLTFTNIQGQAFDRASAAALDVTAKLYGTKASADTLRATTIQLAKALNDPVANLGALSRSGIQFSKDQKEVIKSLVEVGRTADAQNIILQELERQYGGTAEAIAKTSKGMKLQLQNLIGDMMEGIGQIFLPLQSQIIEIVKSVLPQVFGLLGGIAKALTPIIQSAIDLIKSLFDIFFPLIDSLLKALQPIFDVIRPIIQMVIDILTKLQPALNVIFQLVAQLVGVVAELAASALMEMLAPLGDILGEIAIILSDVFVAISPLLTAFTRLMRLQLGIAIKAWLFPFRLLMNIISKVLPLIRLMISLIMDFLTPAFEFMGRVFNKVFDKILEVFQTVLDKIIQGINFLFSWINKIPGIKIELPQLSADALSRAMGEQTTNNMRTNNIGINNQFDINMGAGGGPEMKDNIQGMMAQAAHAAFSIELKRILITAM